MNGKHERPLGLFRFVQGMGLAAMALVIAGLALGIWWMTGALADTPPALLVTALCAGTGGCLLWLLTEFVGMCSRVRKMTAFTEANVRALGRMALALLLCGGFLLPLGKPLMDWLLLGLRGIRSPLWWLLPTFAAWTAALMVRAIQALMRRAVEMQTEADLTV